MVGGNNLLIIGIVICMRVKKFVPNKKGDIGMKIYYLCQPNTYVIAHNNRFGYLSTCREKQQVAWGITSTLANGMISILISRRKVFEMKGVKDYSSLHLVFPPFFTLTAAIV